MGSQLGQAETLLQKTERNRLRGLGRVEKMSNDRLPLMAPHALVPGKTGRGRKQERWTENITYDLEQKGDSARLSVSHGIVASSNDAAYCPVSQSKIGV